MVDSRGRAAVVTGNKFIGCLVGITIANGPVLPAITAKSNFITNTHATGIDLGCDVNVTLSGNTINNPFIGVENVPASFSLAGVTFYNVDTVRDTGFCF